MKFFLKGIGFQWDGDGVFIQAEALGAEQRALWGGRKRPGTGRRRWYGMPRQGTKGGARWHRGDVKKVRVWLQRCYCSPLRYRNGHWQFLQIQDRFFMGLMG